MKTIEFNGAITLDEIFENHKKIIYDSLIESIQEDLENPSSQVTVIKITVNEKEYTINLGRDRFLKSLDRARLFYETLEDYEKCQECVNLSNTLLLKNYINGI
jgi:hypothetical protein